MKDFTDIGFSCREFSQELVQWQLHKGRHGLPWMVSDPYYRWLSEIMLQQTQVSVVVEYFQRFTARFDGVHSLAQAPLEEVLKLWAGLGYYSRARNLHAAAQMICEVYRGEFPQTVEELQKLPGVGRSTAAAIASFCFNVAEPVLDGNVKRVLSRVLYVTDPIDATSIEKKLLFCAKRLVSQTHPGIYNQAMMDVGAMLCTRTRPQCDCCPLAAYCRARALGNPQSLPIKKPKKQKLQQTMRLALWQSERGIFLIQRSHEEIWPGLWCLPPYAGDLTDTVPISTVQHVLTHRILTIEVYACSGAPQNCSGFWVQPEQLFEAPLPAPLKKLLVLVAPGPQSAFFLSS